MVIGGVVDFNQSQAVYAKTLNSLDAASLATATAAANAVDMEDVGAVKQFYSANFDKFFEKNMTGSASNRYEYKGHTVEYDPESGRVTTKVSVKYSKWFPALFNKPYTVLKASNVVKLKLKVEGALSIYMVLDKSGSMGWGHPIKMTTLKTAVDKMVTNLAAADTESKYIRMGAVSYASFNGGTQPLSWNISATNTFVQSMQAWGGTNSSGAVKQAYDRLKGQSEIDVHMQKNQLTPKRVMLFLTDGSNNRSSYDIETIRYCDAAKADGIEIYTIAFQAPLPGQRLLQNCANDSSYYYDAQNADDLIEAFEKIGKSVSEDVVLVE